MLFLHFEHFRICIVALFEEAIHSSVLCGHRIFRCSLISNISIIGIAGKAGIEVDSDGAFYTPSYVVCAGIDKAVICFTVPKGFFIIITNRFTIEVIIFARATLPCKLDIRAIFGWDDKVDCFTLGCILSC